MPKTITSTSMLYELREAIDTMFIEAEALDHITDRDLDPLRDRITALTADIDALRDGYAADVIAARRYPLDPVREFGTLNARAL